jgi:2-polyprenyl-3-methyl-5-hydroxy-6-metoxy-1,4-benzoquinol methylase
VKKLHIAKFVWRFLAPLPAFWRSHQVGRTLLAPVDAVLLHVLKEARAGQEFVMVDLGCGHGAFLALASSEFASRTGYKPKLIGIDLAEDKIALARKAFETAGLDTGELAVKDIAEFSPGSANVITIQDVLYLVPIDRWDNILQKCREALKPGGALLLKEMNRTLRWKFGVLWLEETLAVKILGLTKGNNFTFPTPEEIRDRLLKAGFSDVDEVRLDRGYHVPHMLWVARTATASPA